MLPEKTKKTFFLILIFLMVPVVAFGCSGVVDKRLTKEPVPTWVDVVPEDSFVGVSTRYATEKAARDAAWQNAIGQAANFFDVSVQQLVTRYQQMNATGAETRNVEVHQDSARRQRSSVRLEGLEPSSWFVEQFKICDMGRWRTAYKAYVQVEMKQWYRDRVREALAKRRASEKELAHEIEGYIRNGDRELARRLIDTLHDVDVAKKLRARLDGVSHQFQVKAAITGDSVRLTQGIWEGDGYRPTNIPLTLTSMNARVGLVRFIDGKVKLPIYAMESDSCSGRFKLDLKDEETGRTWTFNMQRTFPWRVDTTLNFPKDLLGGLRHELTDMLKTNGLVPTSGNCNAGHHLQITVTLLKDGPDSLDPDFKVCKVQFTGTAMSGGHQVARLDEKVKAVKLSQAEARQLVKVAVRKKVQQLVDALHGQGSAKTVATGTHPDATVSGDTMEKIDKLTGALGGRK